MNCLFSLSEILRWKILPLQENEGDGLSVVTSSGNFVMHDWDNMPSRVSVSVFNDSDIDGVVSFRDSGNDVFRGNKYA